MTVPKVILDTKFIVVDLETTGFSNSDQIIQIAVAQIDNGQQGVRATCRFKPSVPIGEGATKVHGIAAEHLAYCPPIPSPAGATMASLFGGRCLLGFNVIAFDQRFLKRELPAANWSGIIDVLKWERHYARHEKGHKLQEGCARWGVPLLQGHDAWNDVKMTWALFVTLAREHTDLGGLSFGQIIARQERLGK